MVQLHGRGIMSVDDLADDDRTVSQVPSEQLRLVKEVQRAYADAGPQREHEKFNHDQRCLAFLTSGWFTDGYALTLALGAIREYNRFEAEKVGDCTREMGRTLDNVRVAVGRESSPVLYVESDDADAVIDLFDGYPDECWQVEPEAVGSERKHADEEDWPSHFGCQHDDPINTVAEMAYPDEDREVVRAWWD